MKDINNREILYKYYPFNENTRSALSENYIWCSHPLSFNDPYDCALPLQLENKKLEEIISDYINKKAVTCFSENYKNILMWSHYADNHKGFCIGYKKDILSKIKTPSGGSRLVEVEYAEKMPSITELSTTKEINKLMVIKSTDWEYEKEWRLILEYDKQIDRTQNGRKFSLPLNAIIEEIIIGVKCPQETVEWLTSCFPNKILKKLKLCPNQFKVKLVDS